MKKRTENVPTASQPSEAPAPTEDAAPVWVPPAPGPASAIPVDSEAEVPSLAPIPAVQAEVAASMGADGAANENGPADAEAPVDVPSPFESAEYDPAWADMEPQPATDEAPVLAPILAPQPATDEAPVLAPILAPQPATDEAPVLAPILAPQPAAPGESARVPAKVVVPVAEKSAPLRNFTEHTYAAHAVAKAVGYHGLSIIPGAQNLSLNLNGATSQDWVDAMSSAPAEATDLDAVLTTTTMRLAVVYPGLIFEDLVAEFGYRPTFVTPTDVSEVESAVVAAPDDTAVAPVEQFEEPQQFEEPVEETTDGSEPDQSTEFDHGNHEPELLESLMSDQQAAWDERHGDVVEPHPEVEPEANAEPDVEAEPEADAEAVAAEVEPVVHDEDEEPVWYETEHVEPSQAERDALAALMEDLHSFSDLPATPPMPPIEGEHTPRQD